MDSRAYAEPQFLLTGWPYGDGFAVAASDSLSIAEFKVRTIPLSIEDHRPMLDPAGIDLRVGMERLHFGMGATYQDAMADLFRHWSPDRGPFALVSPALAIGSTTKELAP